MALFDHMIDRGQLGIRASVGTDYSDPDMQNRAIADALHAKMTGTAPNGQARELMHRSAIGLMEHFATVNGIRLRSTDPAEVYRGGDDPRRPRPAHHVRFSDRAGATPWAAVWASFSGPRKAAPAPSQRPAPRAISARSPRRACRPSRQLEPFERVRRNRSGARWTRKAKSLAIASYARAIGVTFKVMVNDDLSAIDRSIRDTAFATAQLKAKLIVAALAANLADGKALFHADHGNIALSGAMDAPDETSLSAGRVALMKQTPPGSTEPLGLSPAILLVPAELQTTSEKLVAAINPASSADVNVFSGKLQVAVEPRLLTGTEWYLFAAPGTYPVIRFLTLAGYEAPRFETSQ